ncbi:amino acid adenylation domain-containing protein [Actinokineospora guangxiensis]|uniref:Amino acid adenylation domain-containing protein n=1 Tax=Actinokineospora guangxiensis TaxID=1490288 RepID=A0ABW0EWW6_9PSEU
MTAAAQGWASPASHEQERVWNDERVGVAASAYSLFGAFEISGPLDVARLVVAIGQLMARYDVLRATFAQSDAGLEQIIWDDVAATLVVDLRELAPTARGRALEEFIARERDYHFDLTDDTLFRTAVVRLTGEDAVLVVHAHHILLDEWSLALLMDEMSDLYARGPYALGEPGAQYTDYAQAQRDHPSWSEADRAFWREELADITPSSLPERPGWQELPRGSAEVALSVDIDAHLLRDSARAAAVTPHTLGLTALSLTLARLGGPGGVPIVVLPVADRIRPETLSMIGLLVNLLPVPLRSRGATVGEALAAVAQAQAHALRRQGVPLAEIALASGRAATDLLSTVYHLHDGDRGHRLRFDGCQVSLREEQETPAQFDLTVGLELRGSSVRIVVQYNSQRYEEPVVQALCADMADFLTALVHDAGGAGAVRSTSRESATAGRDHPRAPVDPVERFAGWVRRQPRGCAVRWAGGSCDYGELADRAGRIAAALTGRGPDRPVGLLMHRGVDAVAAIVAAAWAGVPYVPLNPEDPVERLAAVAGRAGLDAVLVNAATAGSAPPNTTGIDVTTVPHRAGGRAEVPGNAPMAVMHTSGSTGPPKGAVVRRENVAHLVEQDFADLGPGRAVAHASPLAFDASTFEIWGALGTGATIAVIDKESATDARALPPLLRDLDVHTMFVTTSLFNHLVRSDAGTFDGVSAVITGGERADADSFRAVTGRTGGPAVLHAYGPTETTTFTTVTRVADVPSGERDVPLGGPLRGTSTHVLDDQLRALPPGFAGELWIGGAGVTDGYLGAPRATAERFLPDPFTERPGQRMYRSGDHVRCRDDGGLVFVGRGDRQVKVRGHRVELAEVETAALAIPAVANALARAVTTATGEVLIALGVESGQVDAELVRKHLAVALPPYALPATVVVLERFPLKRSGKVDSDQLFATGEPGLAPGADDDPAAGLVRATWTAALGHEPAGTDAHFFFSGGNSLSAVRFLDTIREQTGVDISIRRFLLNPTFGELCEQVRATEPGDDELTAIFDEWGASERD